MKKKTFDKFYLNLNLKKKCVTPPSEWRMSTKLTFLVIDMQSLYKQIPKVEDKHRSFYSDSENRILET